MRTLTVPRLQLPAQWPRLAAALLGFVWFLQIGGWPTLNPSYVAWIPRGDWMQHWLGWLMFRHEPWTFPLGTVTAMPYPVGTTIGFTDSNPLVSILLKPFSGLMPGEVQFIGPWLALCFILQGYFGALLASTVTDDKGQQLLAGYLFVLSPVFVSRIGHDTLCAHWLLLFLMYLGLRDYAGVARPARTPWLAAAAVMLSAGIHPYLTAMSFVLAQAVYVRLWRARLITITRASIAAVLTTVGTLAVFGTLGYIGRATTAAGGFGLYSADLLALVNPREFSRLIQPFAALRVNWEGFGFLGLGGLAGCAVAIVAALRVRPRLRAGTWVVVVAVALLGFYALSADVRLNGSLVMTAKRFYRPLAPLIGPFRASGRFIWPLHYLVLLFGVWGTTRIAAWRRSSPGDTDSSVTARRAFAGTVGTAILATMVVLQATDLDLRVHDKWSAPKDFRRAPIETLSVAAGKYDHVALYPMEVLGVCGNPYHEEHAYRYMLLAYQLHTTYNGGIYARVPAARISAECVRLREEVESGRLDPRTIYIVWRDSMPLFTKAGASCGRFDGDWICVSRDSDERFRRLLETGK